MTAEQSEPMPDDHRAAHERLSGTDKMLAHRIGAVEEGLESLETDTKESFKQHDDRLDKLERERWFLWGAFATAGTLITYVLKGLGLSDK